MALSTESLQAALENNGEDLMTLIPSFMVLQRAVSLAENKETLLATILDNPKHVVTLIPNPLCLQNMLKNFPDYKARIINATFKNTALLNLMATNELAFNKISKLLPEIKEALTYARQLYANQDKPEELKNIYKALTKNMSTLPQNDIKLCLLCVNELIEFKESNLKLPTELTKIKNLLVKNIPRSLFYSCLRFITDHNQKNPQKTIELSKEIEIQATTGATVIPTRTGIQ